MKTRTKKCVAAVCLSVCVVLCFGLGSAFMREPSVASADTEEGAEIVTFAATEDVTETVKTVRGASLEDGVFLTDEGLFFEYSGELGGFVIIEAQVVEEDGSLTLYHSCTDAYIPEYINLQMGDSRILGYEEYTYPVVGIADEAFYGNTNLTSARIGKYVSYMGENAFRNCYALESIEFRAIDAENPSSSYPFYYAGKDAEKCELLIGAETERIDHHMFYYAMATNVTFEEGSVLREIGDGAFLALGKSTGVVDESVDFILPDTVEKVGANGCAVMLTLDEANVPLGVTEAGSNAFSYRDVRTLYFEAERFPDCDESSSPFYGLSREHYYGKNKWVYGNSDLTLYIGREVTRIPDWCFAGETTMNGDGASAYITAMYPEYVSEGKKDDGGYSLEYIGSHAFDNCNYLYHVELPIGVEDVEPYAFSGTPVKDITLGDTENWSAETEDGTPATDVEQVLFGSVYMSEPATVATYWKTTYCSYRFRCTDGFEYERSEDGTYYTVTGYTGDGGAVTVPETHRQRPVKKIADGAFKSDASVTSVVIPESVETIGGEAFYGCTKLASVSVSGEGLESVGTDAFRNCSKLTALYVSTTAAFVSVDYENRYANPLAVVSSNKGKFYVGGSSYTALTITDAERIGTYALAYCTIITSVTIGDGVGEIADYAFYGNTAISSIAIPSSVSRIGEYAFSSMSLDRVTFASPSGWTVSDGTAEVKLAGSDVQTYATDYLTSTYAGYVWTRNASDHAAPTVEVRGVENGGYTNSDVSVTTTVDGESSILYIAYTAPDGNTYYMHDHTLTLSATGASGTTSVTLVNGLYTFVAVDTEGAESEPYYVTFDSDAPDLYVGGSAAWVNYSSTEFSVMAYDTSPVTMYSSRDGGSTWTLCDANPYTVYPEETYATDGEYWFVAVDAAGNVTGPYYTVLDTIAVTGEWETGDDLYPYFCYEAPSYTTWSCTMNGEPYVSGTKLKTCQMTYYVTLVGKNGTSLTTDYTLYHYYPEEGVYTEPTCSAYGYWTYSCVHCEESYIVVDLYSTTGSHDYVLDRKESTCTETGYSRYVCADCEAVTDYEEIAALGHDAVADQMIAATCTTEGYTGKICARCGVLLEGEIIPATGHNYYSVPVSATCTEPAKNVYTCSVCGDTFEAYTDTVLAEHTWGAWDHVSPTCTEDGYESRYCEVCGAEDPDSGPIAATGHLYYSGVWEEWTDPDTGILYRYRACQVCGEYDWYDADDPTEVASNGVVDIFEKYRQYMWWILLAFVAVWSIIIGLRWALQRNDQEKVKTRSMLANYILGLFVIAVILVGLPYLVYGIALLV